MYITCYINCVYILLKRISFLVSFKTGPLLFLAYINDLPEATVSSNTQIFADDTLLYRPITNPHDSSLLQQDLTTLEQWKTKWQMDFNASKCSVIHILPSKRKQFIDSTYTLHGTLDTRDSWSQQISRSHHFQQPNLGKTHRKCNRKREQNTRLPTQKFQGLHHSS